MRSFMRKKGFAYLVGVALVAVLPHLIGLAGSAWMHTFVIVGVYGILTVSLNLIRGYTGQICISHVAMYGIGAYGSALVGIKLGVNFWLALLIGALMAGMVGLFIGWVSLGLRGVYFAITTLAFLRLIGAILTNWIGLTGGEVGLYGVPRPSIGGFVFEPTNRVAWIYLAFGFLILSVFIVDRIVNSRMGRALIAIREDEDLAKSTGINTFNYKMISMGISSFLAGIGGGLYGAYMGTITPADCAVIPSVMAMAGLVMGGQGTMLGPIIGSVFVNLLPELLRLTGEYYFIMFGVIMILFIIFLPRGVMGVIASLRARLRARTSIKEVGV